MHAWQTYNCITIVTLRGESIAMLNKAAYSCEPQRSVIW